MKYQTFIIIISILLVTTGCSKKKKGKTVPSKDKTEQKDGGKTSSDKDKNDKKSGNSESGKNSGTATDKKDKNDTSNNKDNKVTDGKTAEDKKKTPDSGKKPEISKEKKDEVKEKIILAKALVKKGGDKNYSEALSAIREILKKDYQNFEAMYIIVDMEYQRKNFEKMKDVLERIQSLGQKMKPQVIPSGNWHVYMGKYFLNQARSYESKGMTLAAIMEKGKAEKEFGDSSASNIPEALFHYGNLLLEKGDYKPALSAYEKLIKLDDGTYKGNWKFVLNLGVAYFYTGNYLKSEAQYRHVLSSLNRQCMSCHYNLALVYGMWNELPKVGNLSDVERAELIIKHAVIYRNEERKKRRYDKSLVDRLNRWIQSAKDRIESTKRRGSK
ncbi:tetratricopeptide repeat protein [Myxococcota bacterium]|nr:tetratricopeptide repeat protein [Myxococcota bacterium]MBU1380113.1 tetratricopeptide repeat protein [Myxococcota bacterium]MBU1497149.1 tetratricopeptide repeat protein [Myxococcota bacterium]